MPPTKAVREKREAIVIEHMESENRHEFDATLETFGHPRYELIATGDRFSVLRDHGVGKRPVGTDVQALVSYLERRPNALG